MRIVTLSDTHTLGKKIDVPDGDLLIHAGDLTLKGTESEGKAALRWLESLPHKYKLLTPGNHDFVFDPSAPRQFRNWRLYRHYTIQGLLEKFPSVTLLSDSAVEIEGYKIYGSPWVPYLWQPDGIPWAFNFADGEKGRHQAQNTWAKIPDDTEILVTHTPPEGILDFTDEDRPGGDPFLRRRIDQLTNLRLHVFGHLHEGYGRADYETGEGSQLTFVNAAILDGKYEPTHSPIVVDIDDK